MSPVKTKKKLRIGVFDSGVGGLSILKAIKHRLPEANYFYCSDNKNFPYGTKTEEQVVQIAHETTEAFHRLFQLDILVIACNTASTVALPKLRDFFEIPVVGVVPAIKPAAMISKSKVIGLLATPGTVARPYTQNLILQFAMDCEVIKVGSTPLVELAEFKLRGGRVKREDIWKEIAPFFATSAPDRSRLDTIVLGCTHFPLLIEELKAASPWEVNWIDSGNAIGERVMHFYRQAGVPMPSDLPNWMFSVFTKSDGSIEGLREYLCEFGFDGIDILP